ncbi:T9SS type A sorting domain-containing protein [Flavobacterium sp.]|uniref:T9SS type A sorting domain-containing protein n=1 Tax=Flavobacterium sp. TaxID=239 RepID=UPI003D11A49C
MHKKYFYITFLFFLFSLATLAQESRETSWNGKLQEQPLDNLTIYPNPVGTGKITINSRSNGAKEIEIFDVLGKRVLVTVLTTKELNISNLNPGVYIIKIRENEQQVTRKLIVK